MATLQMHKKIIQIITKIIILSEMKHLPIFKLLIVAIIVIIPSSKLYAENTKKDLSKEPYYRYYRRLANKLNSLNKEFINNTLQIDSLKSKVDSLKSKTIILNTQNQEIKDSLKSKNEEIGKLIKSIKNPEVNFQKEVLIPTVLSLVAAIIFWIFFSYIPDRSRKQKIIPKTELDRYILYNYLGDYFDLVMRQVDFNSSLYQSKISSGELTKEEIELGLQNKCLNEKFIYEKEVASSLYPIGRALYELTRKINTKIEKILNFHFYIKPREIILLMEINDLLNTSDIVNYDKDAVTPYRTLKALPLNPSLSYMTNNIYKLYQSYIILMEFVHDSEIYKSKYTPFPEIEEYYIKKEYKKGTKLINKYLEKSNAIIRIYLETYLFLFNTKIKNTKEEDTEKSYLKLEKILAKDPSLHGFVIKELASDPKALKLMEKYFSIPSVEQRLSSFNTKEQKIKEFIKNARKLKAYYATSRKMNKIK